MEQIILMVQDSGLEIIVNDYRNAIKDYRLSSFEDFYTNGFIPKVDHDFFKSQGYCLPVVKLDEYSYLFPANAKSTSKESDLSDYLDFCIVDLDILVITQMYYCAEAKRLYEHNPMFNTYIRSRLNMKAEVFQKKLSLRCAIEHQCHGYSPMFQNTFMMKKQDGISIERCKMKCS